MRRSILRLLPDAAGEQGPDAVPGTPLPPRGAPHDIAPGIPPLALCPLPAPGLGDPEFWSLIDLRGGRIDAPGRAARLLAALRTLPADKLLGFADRVSVAAWTADREDLSDSSDDGFLYRRLRLIATGQATYTADPRGLRATRAALLLRRGGPHLPRPGDLGGAVRHVRRTAAVWDPGERRDRLERGPVAVALA